MASGGFSLDQSWHPNLGAGTKSSQPGGVGGRGVGFFSVVGGAVLVGCLDV